jgi:hypothetical protein
MPDELLDEFFNLSSKLSTISFKQANMGNIDTLIQGFNTMNALLTFLGPSLSDTSKLNLQK